MRAVHERRCRLRLAADPPPPPRASHWDRLPAELHDAVLAAAGPLTAMLCGRIADPRALPPPLQRRMWADALDLDWRGHLRRLPRPWLDPADLARARSSVVFARACWAVATPRNSADLLRIGARLGWLAALPSLHNDLIICDLDRFSFQSRWRRLVAGEVAMWAVEPHELRRLAEYGMVDVLRWCLDNLPATIWPAGCLADAVYGGHLETVKLLLETRDEVCSGEAFSYACRHGFADVVELVLKTQPASLNGAETLTIGHAIQTRNETLVRLLLDKLGSADLDFKHLFCEAVIRALDPLADHIAELAAERGVDIDDDDDGIDGMARFGVADPRVQADDPEHSDRNDDRDELAELDRLATQDSGDAATQAQ
nr:hypothetical protein HK105_000126 [Polyrhizophydium stewartii]